MLVTVDIDDDLLMQTQILAAREHITVSALAEEGLRNLMTLRSMNLHGLPVITYAVPIAGINLNPSHELWDLE